MSELSIELWRRIARKHYHGIWNGEECDHHHHSKDTAERCARTRRRYVSEKIHTLSVRLAEVREDRDRLQLQVAELEESLDACMEDAGG